MSNPLTEKQNKIQANEVNHEYLFTLTDIWQTLKNSWHLIAGIMALFILIAFILTLIIPKQWEAKATLRIGHLRSDTGEMKLIEDPLQTVERTKLAGFKEKILIDMHLPTEKGTDDRTDLLLSSLKGSDIKNTDFINLSARGYSSNDAINILKICIQELKKTHELIVQPIKNRIIKESQATDENLTTASQELIRLNQHMSAAGTYTANSAFAPSIVAINLLANKVAEVQKLKAEQIKYSAILSSFDEQSTSIINTIDISKKPVFPKRSIFLTLGCLLGLLVGIGVALIKNKK
ncbi:MAG: hypothetical protein NVS3B3_01460 [Aquirhabdus sp.]